MKKALTVAILVLLLSLPGFASFKFFFGPAITNLNITEDPDPFEQKALLQFCGGAGFSLNFTPNFALEVDLLYAPGGTKFEYDVPGFGLVSESAKGYGISLPILLKVSFLQGTTPYVVAGGSLVYVMSSRVFIKYPGGSDEEDILDDTERFQYALQFGGGVEFRMAGLMFFVEGRYVLGLSNLYKDPPPGESVKYSNILIFGGIGF